MKMHSSSVAMGAEQSKRKDPCRKLGGYLKQQKGRLYIIRRCVVMLLCWHDYTHDDDENMYIYSVYGAFMINSPDRNLNLKVTYKERKEESKIVRIRRRVLHAT
ncbi:hypothetical protein G4B88_018458 [Cannabis sativa]|uniref:Uncharacterized protein n=2 Tax=Cannabis sativa TaxID=3483 RepID=A0A7J6HHX6_CANSA|nr:hypothetical protein G4B88_018458 [Cannabis sativa]